MVNVTMEVVQGCCFRCRVSSRFLECLNRFKFWKKLKNYFLAGLCVVPACMVTFSSKYLSRSIVVLKTMCVVHVTL